jgi:Core-2/I-Branching enzyme
MTVKIGFVLLTHNKPRQAARLVSRLNWMFERPPIAWHHDFTFYDLPADSITDNVSLVLPHIRTGWARFSVVEAMLKALEILVKSKSSPDWFILLSGADYPIKRADEIVHDLSTSRFDVHMSHHRIIFSDRKTVWQRVAYDRYYALRLRVPFINRTLRPSKRTITLRHPIFTAPCAPFSRVFSCFAGECWFCANRQTAEYLVEFHRTNSTLADHYRILCNSHFKISKNNWRYIDWSHNTMGKYEHPKTLLMEDLAALQVSKQHFARKFDIDMDETVLNAVDAFILR